MKRYLLATFCLLCIFSFLADDTLAAKPNVLLIMTDDQGYGDLSCHGNPVLKTPNLDKLHKISVRLTDFHVAPMCSPTRGQLMTGRDALANGDTAVCQGRSMPRAELPTMADMFKDAGYATGLFGKWHIGDSYPYRPSDRGFDEEMHHAAWGITSLADYWGNDYNDDVYRHNNKLEQYEGYCTDIWFSNAIAWMAKQKDADKPFFCYLPTNVPHTPLICDAKYSAPYNGKAPNGVNMPAGFYGMIANFDENMGKLETFLKKSGLRDNTIVIFLTDNGTANRSAKEIFNAGMRGKKTEMWDGGHRVPCFISWPDGKLGQPRDIDNLLVVQDLLPTLADLCKIKMPDFGEKVELTGGQSFATLLQGEDKKLEKKLDSRMKVIQYRVSGAPWNSAVVLWKKWRLLPGGKLYDLSKDPHQDVDVAKSNPEIVKAMSEYYDKWYAEAHPNYLKKRRIHLGNEAANPAMLYANDWEGGYADNPGNLYKGGATGSWPVVVDEAGDYVITLRRWPPEADSPIAGKGKRPTGKLVGNARPAVKAQLKVGGNDETVDLKEGQTKVTFKVKLDKGKTVLQTLFLGKDGKAVCSAFYTEVERVGKDGKCVTPSPFTHVIGR